jgi:polar amino acid transport system permease protein
MLQYHFQFGDVWKYRDMLMGGLVQTIWISIITIVVSFVIAIVLVFARQYGPKWLRLLIATYVELIRNTPFLIQIFLIFFGLPLLGLRFDANTSGIIAMVANSVAYTLEILRAGIENVGRGQVEAGWALNLNNFRIFRLIVLPQAIRAVAVPLSTQFILVLLHSSLVAAIAASELMSTAQIVEARTFRSFEVYLVVLGLYLALSLVFSWILLALRRFTMRWPEA